MFIYRAKVLDVNDEAAKCDGVFYTVVDSSFDITIQATNCTNEEFAKHFINVHGHGRGHLQDGSVMVIYFNTYNCEVGDELAVNSDDSFNAMLDLRIEDADSSLDQKCRLFLAKHKLPPYENRPEYKEPFQLDDPFEFDGLFDIELN